MVLKHAKSSSVRYTGGLIPYDPHTGRNLPLPDRYNIMIGSDIHRTVRGEGTAIAIINADPALKEYGDLVHVDRDPSPAA